MWWPLQAGDVGWHIARDTKVDSGIEQRKGETAESTEREREREREREWETKTKTTQSRTVSPQETTIHRHVQRYLRSTDVVDINLHSKVLAFHSRAGQKLLAHDEVGTTFIGRAKGYEGQNDHEANKTRKHDVMCI
eukprot:TRINITY_DN1380_c1_g1_i12.p2 TRINITY_DN1380_c1_g1~~TRINITY_DN1380_c1_g1_i12.p2  ORF type:complete len:136 (-),score=6.58 TRINITY_DN1380_c1_g1_i12:2-409(-)